MVATERSTLAKRWLKSRRYAFTLIEAAAALVLLSALATLVVQITAWSAVERRSNQRRQIALAEAANQMERLVADRLSLKPQEASEVPLSKTAEEMLPAGKMTTEVHIAADSPDLKRVVIEVNWADQSGESSLPVRLVTWVFR